MRYKIITMNTNGFSMFIKAALLSVLIWALFTPPMAHAGTDNGVGNDGENNGRGNGGGSGTDNGVGNGGEDNGRGNGEGGSVPINGGIVFLAVAGVAYTAKKFYDLKKQQLAVA